MNSLRALPKRFVVLYVSAFLVLTLTAVVRADWPYGCCESASDECSGDLICKDKGTGTDCHCNILWCEENYCTPTFLD